MEKSAKSAVMEDHGKIQLEKEKVYLIQNSM